MSQSVLRPHGLPRNSIAIRGIVCLIGMVGLALNLPAEERSEPTLASWLKSQSETGRLKIDFYEPGEPRPFPGWTTFEFRIEFQYDCQINWPQKKPRRGSVVLVPTFTKIEVPVTHRVELPKVLKSDRWYEGVLSRHELEHVRVGAHPRLAMLSKHLMRKLKRIERTDVNPDDVTKEWVRKQIEKEMLPRKDSIYELVMETNRNLDKSTNHGETPVQDREMFFDNLYLKAYLDEMKFPYLAEVLDLVESREYLDAHVQINEIDVEVPKPPSK